MWHKYFNIFVLHNNVSNHTSIGCELCRVLLGRVLYNILDSKMGIWQQKLSSPNYQIAQDVLEQTEMIIQDVRKNAMQSYIR